MSAVRCNGASRVDDHDVSVLILENDTNLQRNLSELLAEHYAYVVSASCCEDGMELLAKRHVDVLVVDVSARTACGLQLLRQALAEQSQLMAVAIAETGDSSRALEAIKLGAYQCLSRPLEARSLQQAIDGAARELLTRHSNLGARRRLSFANPGKRLIGNSSAMRDVLHRIHLVREVNSNVLIRGETGTGKELVAHAIHKNSPRAQSPFVKLNCGAIPRDLLESELFGHEKGSFTGALQQRIGRFEMADGGTILLDEIGDMPLELQVKLLSVIQDREFQRVGGHEPIGVDVRILAATHQDLEKAIDERRFREDLYYRLNVVTIDIPPLRDRKEDIPLLVHYFLDIYHRAMGRKVVGVDSEAMQLLMSYSYPGNIRELENIIEGALVLCEGGAVTPEELPPRVRRAVEEPGEPVRVPPGTPLEEVEKLCIIETLKHTEGNKRRAASLLGISEKSVYNKLGRYKISTDAILGDEDDTADLFG